MKNINKIKGCMLGGAIGDALGYERKNNIVSKSIQSNNKIVISDNTQMALFTANALLYEYTNYSINKTEPLYRETIYLSYLDWLQTQTSKENGKKVSWIRDIQELNLSRSTDNNCIKILESGVKGTLEKPINNYNEAIAITRIAPIGLFLKNKEEVGMVAASSSALTHGNPLVIISSYALSLLIHFLSTTNKSIKDSLTDAIYLCNKVDIYDQKTKEYFNTLMNKVINLSEQNISDIEAIRKLGEGYKAEEAFAIALYSCLKYLNSFNDAIMCSISHGGNSSATGAITGNIIGTYLGYYKIPHKLINNLEMNDVINEIASDLGRDYIINKKSNKIDNSCLDKYVNVKVDINEKRKNIKTINICLALLFGIIFLLSLKTAISNYVKYFESISKVPIKITDNGITNLINHSYTLNILSTIYPIIIFLPFLAIIFIKNNKQKKSKDKIFLKVILILCFVALAFVSTTLSIRTGKTVDNNDWTISVATIEKKQRGGRKSRNCYVYLKGIPERKKVSQSEYNGYLSVDDDVYVIYDKKNNKINILSPKHYKYIGNRLENSKIVITNNRVHSGYFLFIAINLTIATLFFFLLCLHRMMHL